MKLNSFKMMRFLRYGRIKDQKQEKKQSILIYYDTLEHKFVYFSASAKTSKKAFIYNFILFGIIILLLCWDELISWITPYQYSIATKESALTQWLNQYKSSFHWWIGIIIGIIAIGWYIFNRHIDPNEFKEPTSWMQKDLSDSNKDCVFLFLILTLFDFFFILLLYSASDFPFPYVGLSDIIALYFILLFTFYFACLVIESLIAYVKYLWDIKIKK